MFARRANGHIAAVAVAAVASLASPALAGTFSSTDPGAGVAAATAVHRPGAPPVGLATSTPCGGVRRSPVPLPPVTAAPVFIPGPPAAPGLCPLQASQADVVVSWYNRSVTASSFIVYRLDSQGNRQVVDQVTAVTGAQAGQVYSWTDTGTGQGGQCYVVAAVNAQGDGDSQIECTVRPNPSLPSVPVIENAPVIQWSGLSSTNDGTGPLVNSQHGSADHLIWSQNTFSFLPFHCGCGVDLAFTNKTSLWKVQATGTPVIMYGEAVAFRVWGGGWLEYAYQTWGVSLHLVSTPVYQWYLLGATTGTTLDSSEFALWNSAADDFLVEHDQTYGPDIEWLKKTLTPPRPRQRPRLASGWSSPTTATPKTGRSRCGPRTRRRAAAGLTWAQCSRAGPTTDVARRPAIPGSFLPYRATSTTSRPSTSTPTAAQTTRRSASACPRLRPTLSVVPTEPSGRYRSTIERPPAGAGSGTRVCHRVPPSPN